MWKILNYKTNPKKTQKFSQLKTKTQFEQPYFAGVVVDKLNGDAIVCCVDYYFAKNDEENGTATCNLRDLIFGTRKGHKIYAIIEELRVAQWISNPKNFLIKREASYKMREPARFYHNQIMIMIKILQFCSELVIIFSFFSKRYNSNAFRFIFI